MDFDHVPEFLNSVYEPLCIRTKKFCDSVKEQNIPFERGFYNHHTVRKGDSYFLEHFPIPVVTLKCLGDFGFELDHVFFEAVIPRNKALELDFTGIARDFDFDVYGAENYLCDFYHAGMDVSCIRELILSSAETEICVSLRFPPDTDASALLGSAKRLVKK